MEYLINLSLVRVAFEISHAFYILNSQTLQIGFPFACYSHRQRVIFNVGVEYSFIIFSLIRHFKIVFIAFPIHFQLVVPK